MRAQLAQQAAAAQQLTAAKEAAETAAQRMKAELAAMQEQAAQVQEQAARYQQQEREIEAYKEQLKQVGWTGGGGAGGRGGEGACRWLGLPVKETRREGRASCSGSACRRLNAPRSNSALHPRTLQAWDELQHERQHRDELKAEASHAAACWQTRWPICMAFAAAACARHACMPAGPAVAHAAPSPTARDAHSAPAFPAVAPSRLSLYCRL